MNYWNICILIACTLLLLFLLWKEWRRPNKSWLAARMAASVIAIGGLAGMGLPLTYQQKQKATEAKEAVLLTAGFEPDSLNAFLHKNGNVPVYTTDRQYASDKYQYVADVSYFNNSKNDVRTIHLFGSGLAEDELASIRNIPIIYHPVQIKSGITAISWNQQMQSGNKLRVQGHLENNNSPVKIILSGFDVHLDSVLMPAGASRNFELSTIPKHLDKAVYTITVLAGKDTLESEPLPVEVLTPEPIKILFLASSPDFENKFIKNWLAQNNYQAVARTRISKDKFNEDFLNISNVPVHPVSVSLLKQFDVIIADAAELKALTPSENAAIQSAVNQVGVGLIIKMDTSANTGNSFIRDFPLIFSKSNQIQPVKLTFTDDSSYTFQSIKINQPLYIREQPGTQPLVRTAQAEIIISSKIQGLGKVIITTLSNTYSWQLSGSTTAYSAFWTTLLQKAARKKEKEEFFTISPAIPVVNEKAIVHLQTAVPETPQVFAATDEISMEQNYQLPFLWKGYYWPLKKGWLPITTGRKNINRMYIFESENWKYVRWESKKNNTLTYAAVNNRHVEGAFTERVVTIEIPKIYFFILFIFSAAFLWFEKKFKGA